MYALLLILAQPDAARLDHPSYGRRESAEQRLAALGPLAWPVLLAQGESESPERRQRVARLLTPYRRFRGFLEAAGVLLGDDVPKPWEFYRDESLRFRVWTLAAAGGVPGWACRAIDPAFDPSGQWWGVPVWCGCAAALDECRKFFREGVEPVPVADYYP